MLADTRLVLLVDFDQRSQRDAALSRGFSEVVFKPVKQSLLFDAIANAVSAPLEPESQIAPEWMGLAKDDPGKAAGSVPGSVSRKGIILLAEDNPANQKLAIIQLQKLGYEAEVVENGLQAVNAVVESPDRYQLLLMDCQMPDMDGFEATRQIRKIEKIAGRHIPIVAMTANAMQGDRDACIAVGMDDYIGKPVILKNLETVLTRWVEGRGGAAAGEIQPVSGGFHVVPLDMEIFNGLRALQSDGETDFVNDLIDMYLQDSRLMMEAIHRGAQNHDFVLLWQSAHRLKGNSSNLGALAIAAICNEVENRGKASDLTGMEDLLKRLDAEYIRTCSALIQEKSIH
jgi:CheY-like chemotaxis protein